MWCVIKMTADDLKEEAESAEEAEEATKGYLSPLDEINKYEEKKDNTYIHKYSDYILFIWDTLY